MPRQLPRREDGRRRRRGALRGAVVRGQIEQESFSKLFRYSKDGDVVLKGKVIYGIRDCERFDVDVY
jgi:hypothetical protein